MSLTRKTLYIGFAALLAFALLLCIQPTAAAQGGAASAATPPMGWNSWDSYGTTVNEAQVKANADWMAKNLKAFGWQYIVVDMEWFVTNPIPEGNSKDFKYSLDANGRYTPPVNRFPSAGDAGFKPLADYVHSLGLKFGIHILRCRRGRHVGNLHLELRQLRRERHAGGPGLLRLDRAALRPLGRGSHQGGLHCDAVQGLRDSHVEHRAGQDRPFHRAEPFPGSGPA
jgi:hypothetical protein